MQVARWGNSLAIRLPAIIVKVLDLKEGDDIEIVPVGTRSLEVVKSPDLDAMLARLDRYRGSLPADFKFDRLEANAR